MDYGRGLWNNSAGCKNAFGLNSRTFCPINASKNGVNGLCMRVRWL